MINKLKQDLQALRNEEKIKVYSNFFKTGKGEYGEGDKFLGISVPDTRKIARKYLDLSFENIRRLLEDKIHDYRLAALLILVERYKKADSEHRKDIVDFYLANTDRINNWDLVDLTANKILGDYLMDKNKDILYKLAKSNNLWERRIAVIATFRFIREKKFEDTFKIAEILMNDKHDLIHKAVGWMLRELGKRNQQEGEAFLMKHYKNMPRTMLRYAIERFDDDRKGFYLKK